MSHVLWILIVLKSVGMLQNVWFRTSSNDLELNLGNHIVNERWSMIMRVYTVHEFDDDCKMYDDFYG